MDAVAYQALDEIEGGCPLLDALDIESEADRLWPHHEGDMGRLYGYLGLTLRMTHDLPDGAEGLTLGRLVLVRQRRNGARARVAITHEGIHVVLDRAHPHHTHPDVWCLTLATLAPRILLARMSGTTTAETIALRAGMPFWAAAARLRMGAIKKIIRRAA